MICDHCNKEVGRNRARQFGRGDARGSVTVFCIPCWGEIFADPSLQRRYPLLFDHRSGSYAATKSRSEAKREAFAQAGRAIAGEWMCSNEMSRRIGVGHSVISRWADRGALEQREAVGDETMISGGQVSVLMRVPPDEVETWEPPRRRKASK